MSKIEITAIIILIITVVCLIVLPRLFYRKKNPVDTIEIIYAIFTTAAVEIGLLGGLIVLLMGLIISFRK
jgi:hypothetical protein